MEWFEIVKVITSDLFSADPQIIFASIWNKHICRWYSALNANVTEVFEFQIFRKHAWLCDNLQYMQACNRQ